MTDSRRQPPICHDRHERDITALIAQYGGACWPLDDDLNTVARTGVVRELSGQYPGAVSATGVSFGQPGPVLGGKLQAAAGFDGAAGQIDLGPDINVTGSFTLMCWARWTEATNKIFIGKSHASNYYMNTANGRLSIWCRGKNAVSKLAGDGGNIPPANSGQWNFICGRINATNPNDCIPDLFLNGVRSASFFLLNSSIQAPIATTDKAYLASSASITAAKFIGDLAYAAIIPAALTSNDIFALYNGALGG